MLTLAEDVGSFQYQREALTDLLELNRSYNYTDQVRVLNARLSRIDAKLKSEQIDTMSVRLKIAILMITKDAGSIDSELFRSDLEETPSKVRNSYTLFISHKDPSPPMREQVVLTDESSPIKPISKVSFGYP